MPGFSGRVFAAVALHKTELSLAKDVKHNTEAPVILASSLGAPESATTSGVDIQANAVAEPSAIVSEGSLVFKEHLERLSEVLLILMVGDAVY